MCKQASAASKLESLHAVRIVAPGPVTSAPRGGGEGSPSRLELLAKQDFGFRAEEVERAELDPSLRARPWLRGLWRRRPAWLRAVYDDFVGDHTPMESAANILTSVPFVLVGLTSPKKTQDAALFGRSVVGVGLASMAYHASRGRARRFFRWGDYAAIAASSVCLSRAVSKKSSPALMAASAAMLPFQPMLVIALHTGIMEATFVRRALKETDNPDLQRAHRQHAAAALAGGALFLADDVFPDRPYIHAAWHVAAALGIYTARSLLE